MSGLSQSAARRALEALVQASGVPVALRVAQVASAGDDKEQLGLASVAFVDHAWGRGVLRGHVLLITTRPEAGEAEPSTCVESLLADAAGMVVGTDVRGMASYRALRAGDGVYGYAVTLAAERDSLQALSPG